MEYFNILDNYLLILVIKWLPYNDLISFMQTNSGFTKLGKKYIEECKGKIKNLILEDIHKDIVKKFMFSYIVLDVENKCTDYIDKIANCQKEGVLLTAVEVITEISPCHIKRLKREQKYLSNSWACNRETDPFSILVQSMLKNPDIKVLKSLYNFLINMKDNSALRINFSENYYYMSRMSDILLSEGLKKPSTQILEFCHSEYYSKHKCSHINLYEIAGADDYEEEIYYNSEQVDIMTSFFTDEKKGRLLQKIGSDGCYMDRLQEVLEEDEMEQFEEYGEEDDYDQFDYI